MTLKNYSETTKAPEKKAVVYFTDSDFKPLVVDKTRIASVQQPVPYKNHLAFLPRAGDSILVGESSVYKVKEVVHSLPSMHSGSQRIYIVLE